MSARCRVCGSEATPKFKGRILNKHDVDYSHCGNCGFLQTEEPYWLDEAYQEAINASDTGVMARCLEMSEVSASIIHTFFERRGRFLDYGGGYGILTRLMRDRGFDFYWYDPFSQNLVARGFEYKEGERVEMVTSFETFEHFVHPMEDIEKMLRSSNNLLFSTLLLPEPIPEPGKWWYYGLDHGQHISFYAPKTLRYIADKFGLHVCSVGPLHLLSEREISHAKVEMAIRLRKAILPLMGRGMKGKTVEDMNYLIEKRMLGKN
jgi:2-polyprenyl-3-methyl-5-hydroxy-6-metoxy-1,4-benzoquinol methylase